MSLDDLRIAIRSLRKQPAFAAVVIISLALGIALNTTMYGMLDALIKPHLDIRDPESLYRIAFFGDNRRIVDGKARDEALASGMRTYDAITRMRFTGGNQLIEHGQTILEATAEAVQSNYFDVLGVRPLAGRTFLPSDETAELPPVVISDVLAAQLFPAGGSPVGARIKIHSEKCVVIGVISHASNLPGDRIGAWQVPRASDRAWHVTIVRLRAGFTAQDLDHELTSISNRIALAAGDNPSDDAFRVHQAADPRFQFTQIHYALIAAVVAVLLVACSNLANIQLSRGIGRRRELALRSALGASRRRLIVYLLTETTILAVIGLALGLVLTYWGSRALAASIPPSVGSYIVEPQISWRVLVFALGATVFCLLAVGLLPSIGISRTDPNDLLKSGAGTGATRTNRRKYAILVGTEIALALALSCLAAVTVRTTILMNTVGNGFDYRPLSTGLISPNVPRRTVLRYGDMLRAAEQTLETVPDVSMATASIGMPVENNAVSVDDAGGVREVMAPMYSVTVASPSFVRTYGFPIVRGRDFLEGERDHGAVIIDERTARILWPNANPIGALVKFGDKLSKRPYVRVVGVIGEDKRFPSTDYWAMRGLQHSLGQILYLPEPGDSMVVSGVVPVRFVARAAKRPAQLPIVIRHAAEGWGGYRSFAVSTMDSFMGISRQRESARFMAMLFMLFATMGVGLAAYGVYGVVAHAVAERRRELGVRVALGATPRDILHAVLRETVVVALAGAAGGLLLTRFDTDLLAQLARVDERYDAPTFAMVALIVVAAAAASAIGPALRATRVDPTESLRAE